MFVKNVILKEPQRILKRQFAVFGSIFFEYQDFSDYWVNLGTDSLIDKRKVQFFLFVYQ